MSVSDAIWFEYATLLLLGMVNLVTFAWLIHSRGRIFGGNAGTYVIPPVTGVAYLIWAVILSNVRYDSTSSDMLVTALYMSVVPAVVIGVAMVHSISLEIFPHSSMAEIKVKNLISAIYAWLIVILILERFLIIIGAEA